LSKTPKYRTRTSTSTQTRMKNDVPLALKYNLSILSMLLCQDPFLELNIPLMVVLLFTVVAPDTFNDDIHVVFRDNIIEPPVG
jgi:hypothetical protein